MSNTVMVKLDKKIKIIKMNHEVLPAPNSRTCFTLAAMSKGKNKTINLMEKVGKWNLMDI